MQVTADGSGDHIAYSLFAKPVEPKTVPWPALCDIGDKSKEWRGVAVRVTPGENQISGSPIWLSGNNCVGAKLS